MMLDECDRLFKLVTAASSPAEACYALDPIFAKYELITIELGRANVFWRARSATDQPWLSISLMGYPPGNLVKAGRLNDELSPCFYAATDENTALAEIGVQENDFAQVAGFRIKLETPIRIAVIGELYHVSKMGYLRLTGTNPNNSLTRYLNDLGTENGRCMLYIDAFLAHLLADPEARTANYILSRSIAAMIYRNREIDGIIFPSVRDQHGTNLALKAAAFDPKVHAVCCFHARIKKLRSFGFVDYEVIRETEKLSPEGQLIWREPRPTPVRHFFNLTKEEYDAAIQNPDDPNTFNRVMSTHVTTGG